MHAKSRFPVVGLFVAVLCVTGLATLQLGCDGGGEGAPETVTLQGTGASFPAPLYQRWFSELSPTPHPVLVALYKLQAIPE